MSLSVLRILLLFAAINLLVVVTGCGRDGTGNPAVPPTAAAGAADDLDAVAVSPTEKVFFRGDARPRAERLGQLLTAVGYFNGRSSSAAEVRNDGGTWRVRVLLGGPGWADPGFQALWRNWHGPLAAANVFPGDPVEILLCDDQARPQVRLPVPPTGAVAAGPGRVVMYHEPHRDKAERLSAGLFATGPGGPPGWSFLLARDTAGWVLTYPLGAGEMRPEQEWVLREMRSDFARTPFDGGPLRLVVLDAGMQARWTFAD